MSFRAPLYAMAGLVAGAAPMTAHAGPKPKDDAAPVASPVAAERVALGLDLRVAQADLDTTAVRDAITSELGVPVTEATERGAALGIIIVTLDRSAARVVYRRSGSPAVERTLALPAAPADRVQMIAFIVTNLVRDQASELLARLAPHAGGSATPDAAIEAAIEAPPDKEIAATIGLVPPLAVDRLYGEHVVVGAGLHLVMGVEEGSRYVSISGALDYQRRFAEGAQLAGAAAISRRVSGAQIAGALTVASDMTGWQVAGAASIASRVHGLQVAGATTYADEVHGVQIAGGSAIAGEVHGVQISGVNIAGKLHGLQLGLINVSDGEDDAIPIGAINIARHGRTEVEATVDSSEMATLTLRHGPRRVQNVWGVGWVSGYDKALVGLGLGYHQVFDGAARPITLDVDAMIWNPLDWDTKELALLNQLRATIAVPVGPIDIVGGAVGNVYIDDGMGALDKLHPHAERTYTSGTTHVTLWPSGFLGLRLRA